MSFDLNIDNYTKQELASLFELPPNYDDSILEIKESKLRENIMKNTEINKDTQTRTINFLVKAKTILLNNYKSDKNPELQQKILDFYNTSYELKSTKLEDTDEHMVQVRPEKPYLSSYPSEFFPGVINPLKKRTIKKNLNIDTRFRENYFSSPSTNFNFALPINFDNVLQMQLTSIELPITYYNVSKQYGNNYFSVTANTSTSVVNIPDGNYNCDGIVNIINIELTKMGGLFAEVVFLLNINNNSGSGQMMVGIIPGSTITSLSLNFQADRFGIDDRSTPLPLKFGWTLGFRNGIYANNLNYVSEGVVDVTGPRYIYLVLDDHNNNVNNGFYSAFNSSLLNNNILARISLQSKFFDVQITNNLNIVTNPREYFGPINIQNISIQLLDEYGRVLDINNMDYSFCLTLVTAYDI
jgi:hypothetical protein